MPSKQLIDITDEIEDYVPDAFKEVVPDTKGLLGAWDWFIWLAVLYSVVTFVIETQVTGNRNSLQGPLFYLWSERVVAVILTGDFFFRWYHSRKKNFPMTPLGFIDLLSMAPFWIGFFVTGPLLTVVRCLRVLRLLKYIRYSPKVQLVAKTLASSWNEIVAISYLFIVVFLLGSITIYELERDAQPDSFSSLGASMWWMFVSVTTIGYGDMYPITPLGRLFASVVSIIGLGVAASFIGIIVTSISTVLKTED